MKISIITVCYNSAATIRDTIESVLSQTYLDIEYIIVDGASTDHTLEIVNEYRGRIARVVSEPDRGVYDAMNKGIRMAAGDVVGILNSDDIYENENVIATIAAALSEQPSADMVFGDVVFATQNDLDRVVRYYRSAHFRRWKLRFGWMPPHPATFVKKSVYDRLGLYGLDYKIAADYEIFVRWLLLNKLEYRRVETVLVRMRTGGLSTAGWRSSLLLNKEIVQACRRNGVYTNLPLVLTKIPFKLMELQRRPIAASK